MAMSGDGKKLAAMGGKLDGHKADGSSIDPRRDDARRAGDPEWTSGLKKLYNSVVDEPLPDAFMDLLSKLDSDSRK